MIESSQPLVFISALLPLGVAAPSTAGKVGPTVYISVV